MNVFLTGNVQVGKSTAIKRFLENTGIKPLGFTTQLDRNTGSLFMNVMDNTGDILLEVARPGGVHRPIPDMDAFNKAGAILRGIDTSECRLLIMDELGFMEKDAELFMAAVPELLDRGIPTVGVLRYKEDGPFWRMLHEREDTVIVTVTEENRSDIPDIISRYAI